MGQTRGAELDFEIEKANLEKEREILDKEKKEIEHRLKEQVDREKRFASDYLIERGFRYAFAHPDECPEELDPDLQELQHRILRVSSWADSQLPETEEHAILKGNISVSSLADKILHQE